MISDQDRRLIAAFVADDLDGAARRDAERLIERSPETRRLAEQLQDDGRRLRALPRCRPAVDVAGYVLREIVAGRAGMRPARPRPIAIFTWGSLAAAVLVAFVTATYLLLADLQGPRMQARRPANSSDRPIDRPMPPTPRELASVHPNPDHPPFVGPPAPAGAQPSTDANVRTGPSPEVRPESAAAKDAVLSSAPKPDLQPRAVVLPSVSLPLPLRELDRAELRQKLDAELRKEEGYRLELFCRDSTKALERLQATAKARDLPMLVDAAAQELIKHKLRVPYVVYVEGLAPEQLVRLLKDLGVRDRKAEERRAGEGAFDQLVLMPLTADDRKELVALLGVDPTQPVAKPKGPLGVDVRKPLSESTAAQVAQSPPGQGGRPDALALVLPYGVVRSPAASKEVKQFLTGRRERSAGTIAVYLILRPSNG